MDVKHAHEIFEAVTAMTPVTQALFELQQVLVDDGFIADEEIVTVITDYVNAKRRLDSLVNEGYVGR